MPRTQEQYEQIRREKRELIKEKALSLFAEKGFEATSMNDIAKAAGISKGLTYNYFASKEELLQTIWDDLVCRFENMVDPNHDGEITPEEAKNFIDVLFEDLKQRNIYKLYFQLSFQPKVLDFLTTKYNMTKALKHRNLLLNCFCEMLPLENKEFTYFTLLVFLKGLSMVTAYTEDIYNNDFLDKYKIFLKGLLKME